MNATGAPGPLASGLQQRRLRDGEDVIRWGAARYRWPLDVWREGDLYLTSDRLIWFFKGWGMWFIPFRREFRREAIKRVARRDWGMAFSGCRWGVEVLVSGEAPRGFAFFGRQEDSKLAADQWADSIRVWANTSP